MPLVLELVPWSGLPPGSRWMEDCGAVVAQECSWKTKQVYGSVWLRWGLPPVACPSERGGHEAGPGYHWINSLLCRFNAAFITCENSNGWPRDCKVGSASLSQDFLPDSDLGVDERQRKTAYQAGMGSLPFRNMWYHHGDPVVATSKLKVGRRTGVPLGLGEDLRKAKGRGSTWASLEDIGGRQCRIS